MKPRIYVFEEKGYQILPTVRESFQHAANRWGSELVFLKRLTVKGNFWMQKQQHVLLTKQARRVLWLDGDMLIRVDCPNPFDFVPVHKIGYVSVAQDHRKPVSHYPQGGFQIYHTQYHLEILRRIDVAFKSCGYQGMDQDILGCIVNKDQIQWLPSAFNFLVFAPNCVGWLSKWHEDRWNTSPVLPNWICHLRNGMQPGQGGWKNKALHISRFDWKLIPKG